MASKSQTTNAQSSLIDFGSNIEAIQHFDILFNQWETRYDVLASTQAAPTSAGTQEETNGQKKPKDKKTSAESQQRQAERKHNKREVDKVVHR